MSRTFCMNLKTNSPGQLRRTVTHCSSHELRTMRTERSYGGFTTQRQSSLCCMGFSTPRIIRANSSIAWTKIRGGRKQFGTWVSDRALNDPDSKLTADVES